MLWRRMRRGGQSVGDAFDRIYARLISHPAVTILDVGAHRGESVRRFSALFPEAEIHAFEPDRENFRAMQEGGLGANARIVLNHRGVGRSAGQLVYHAYKKTNVGGFKEIDPGDVWTKLRSQQYGVSPDAFKTASYEVEVVSIDQYLRDRGVSRVDVMKVDTQGFEEQVLHGAAGALAAQSIDFVELELIVRGPYRDPIGFRHLEDILVPSGYVLFGIRSGNDLLSSPILQFDVLFARQGIVERLTY